MSETEKLVLGVLKGLLNPSQTKWDEKKQCFVHDPPLYTKEDWDRMVEEQEKRKQGKP